MTTSSTPSTSSNTTASAAMSTDRTMQRRVVSAASIGQFIEFYDFAIYGLAAVAIADAFFPSSSGVIGLLSALAVYGVAFVVRPLGGLFFGSLGDRIGRKAVLTISLTMIGGATTLMGLLPGYDQIGILAPLLLVALRLLQGFSAGGEAIGAPSFVLEHAPRDKRASWITIAIAMSATPSVVAGILYVILDLSMTDASYNSWGWRIPFLIAAPMTLIGLYIRRRTVESPIFEALKNNAERAESPLRSTLRRDKIRMVQVFCVMSLSALGFYFLVGYFVTYLQTTADLSRGQSLIATCTALLAFAILLPIGGRISDRLGRRTMLRIGSIGMLIVAWPAFLMVSTGHLLTAIAGQILMAIPLCFYGGGSYTFFVELFPPATRLSGAAISYNVAFAVFGGAAPFAGAALVSATGWAISPAFLIFIAGVLAVGASLRVPETAGRDLLEEV